MTAPSRPVVGALSVILAIALVGLPADAAFSEDSIAERLAVAGLDVHETRRFLRTMKHAVSRSDSAALARMARFAITVAIDGRDVELIGQSEFIDRYPAFMTPALKALVDRTALEDLFANYQGAMLGNGALWFGPVCERHGAEQSLDSCANPPIRILRINGVQ